MILTKDKGMRMWGGGFGGGSGGSGGSGSGGGGGVTEAWVDANYVSKEFFSRLFKAYDSASTPNEVEPNDMSSTITNIKAMFGLWTEQFLSAMGQGSGGGGGGGIDVNRMWQELATNDPTHIIDDSHIPTLAMSKISGLASALSNKADVNAISDMATKTWVGQQGFLTSSDISDMATKTWVGQQGFLTSSAISDMATMTWVGQQGFLTSSDISDMATKTWVTSQLNTLGDNLQSWVQQQGYLTSSAISDMATKTWVGQQGFLTSVSGTLWGKPFTNGATISGSLRGVGSITSNTNGIVDGFSSIELKTGNNAGPGGYIDFHFNGSSAD